MEHLNLISALLRSAVDLAAGPLAHSQPPQPFGGFFIVSRSRERYVCFLERKIHVSKTQTVSCKNTYRTNRQIMVNALPVLHDFSRSRDPFSPPLKTLP